MATFKSSFGNNKRPTEDFDKLKSSDIALLFAVCEIEKALGYNDISDTEFYEIYKEDFKNLSFNQILTEKIFFV